MESYFQSGRLLMMAAMIFYGRQIPPVVQPCSETDQLDFKQL